jgi:hypothetical protein
VVQPVIATLKKHVSAHTGDMKDLKVALWNGLHHHWPSQPADYVLLTMVLDPRTKTLACFGPDVKTRYLPLHIVINLEFIHSFCRAWEILKENYATQRLRITDVQEQEEPAAPRTGQTKGKHKWLNSLQQEMSVRRVSSDEMTRYNYNSHLVFH